MKVVVTGATGNVGISITRALSAEPAITELIRLARRVPATAAEGGAFIAADVSETPLEPIFRGADAVVHLAWLIQPGRDESVTERVNVEGSRRVFGAAVRAGVPAIIYASSVGVYSPGPKDVAVDESWPCEGIKTSFYSRHKAQVERMLDLLQREHPQLRIVRLRPGLIFQRAAATEIRRLFLGPLIPTSLFRASLVPIVPDVPRLAFQAVHADDVADAYRRALISDAAGAFNLAADPVIDVGELARALDAKPVAVPAKALRAAAATTFKLRLQPVEPGWIDLALGVPVMSSERARRELGWVPRHSSLDAAKELMRGLREHADGATPPLAASTSGPARIRELLTGVGKRT